MRELELIDALGRVLVRDGARVVRWLGDDASVVRAGGYAVTSVDTMVDGVHFRTEQLSDREVGHRALAAAVSDLAAMAASPARPTSRWACPRASSPSTPWRSPAALRSWHPRPASRSPAAMSPARPR